MNFCLGELFWKLLTRIGKWHQNLSEKTGFNYRVHTTEKLVQYYSFLDHNRMVCNANNKPQSELQVMVSTIVLVSTIFTKLLMKMPSVKLVSIFEHFQGKKTKILKVD